MSALYSALLSVLLHVPLENRGIQGIADASIKGVWQFGGKRGALLIMSHPRIESMPAELLEYLTSSPLNEKGSLFKEKGLVTEIHTCPAYSLFMSAGSESTIRCFLWESYNRTL